MAAWSRRIAIACCIAACGGVWFTADGCTRAVYLGPDDMVVTGRTMDWKEDPQSNIYVFPRGIERRGGLTDNSVKWKSVYGSVVTAGYDIGVCDGINERGWWQICCFWQNRIITVPAIRGPLWG